MPHLAFHDTEKELFVHLLRPGRTVVGRSDRCDLALPSDSVSRIHCVVENRGSEWWLTDRSRNGTRLNGQAVTRQQLADGDRIEIGQYSARFGVEASQHHEGQTTSPMAPAEYEALVDVANGAVATARAELVCTRGPLEGQTFLLDRPRSTVGGLDADIVLEAGFPKNSLRVRVVRGRVMLEPGEVAVSLNGTRVREITPAFVGEEIRIGEHGFAIAMRMDEEQRDDLTTLGEMVGQSPVMRRLFGILARVAAHDDTVLLTGESGTGKELASRAVHSTGPRQDGPFVAVNCAAIAETLFESELFGHEKGAFTGATQRQDGAFQRADGGTLFLDEIGELRLDMQAKLLRALESGEVRRVGGTAADFPDVRVIAATNRNLPEMVRAGTFRGDLYFRLAVLTVRMPALRERKGDIGPIARILLTRQHPGAQLTADALRALELYAWPGNVRELRNVLTRAFVLNGPQISASSLEFNPWAFEGEIAPSPEVAEISEREAVREALERHEGNRTRAARDLGIPRSSLLYKLKRLGLD